MKKSFKSVLSLSITIALVMGILSGCSAANSPTPSPTASPTSTATVTPTKAPTVEPTATPTTVSTVNPSAEPTAKTGSVNWKPFEKTVNITVPVYDRSKEGYPAVDDNYWTQWVQSSFGDIWNINVEYVAIPRPSADLMTKYSLLIASGDTPTIMMEYDYPKVAQWAGEGAMQVIDLNEFKEVAPNFYRTMADNNQLGYTDINGETFFVLTERPYYNTTYTYANFIRLDWLEAVGLDIPQSYEEDVVAMEAFMEAGLTDIAPYGLSLPTGAYVANFAFRDYPVDEAEWAMHSSLGTPSLSWYPTEKLLKRQNAEYNAGWYSTEYDLDKGDFAGGGDSQMKTDFINGKIYRFGGYMSSNVDWLNAFYANNPDAKLAVECQYRVEEPGFVDYAQIRADNPFGMIVGFSSLASKDQLKAAWMLMEWMLQPEILFTLENGIEGLTYSMGEDGLPVVDMEYRGVEMLNHNMNIDMTCLVHAGKKQGTIEQTIAAISPRGLPQDFTQELIDNYYELKEIADKGHAYSDPVFAVVIESEREYSATLLSLYKEYSVALTKCAPDEFDALYAELSQKFLDAGYREIIDERLAAYEAGNTTKLPR